jgi:flagella basal body P-ring formation protein FlgA
VNRLLALIAAGLLLAAPAVAGQPVTLRADVVDADGTVTLGDLFENAGAAAGTPVATRFGAGVILNAQTVQTVARRAGLDWANAQGLSRIVVHAAATPGGPAAAARGGAQGNVEVLTYARSLATGDIVQPQDLVWAKAAAAPADAASDVDQLIGMTARRPLRAGAPASPRDVGATQVIRQNDIITVTYEDRGISLALQGRALAPGGIGDQINVQNPASKKIIQAVVTGPGAAAVGPAADQLRLSHPSRYALR